MSATRQMLPWIWTVLIGTAGVVVLLVGLIPSDTENLAAVMAVAVLILITSLGSVISARQPGNRIAWLLHAISVGLLLSMAASLVTEANQPPISPDFWDYAAFVMINGLSLSFLYPIFLTLFIFPTGRFLTRRWRWAGWMGVLFVPVVLLVGIFSKEFGPIWAEEPWAIPNPIGLVPVEVGVVLSQVWTLGLLVLAVGGVAALIVRYRRSEVVVRTQIKWVLYAAVVAAVSLPFAFGDGDPLLTGLLYVTMIGAIPVGITVAVTRYKLFEIDRIISRTISYAIVVGLLAAAFFGLIAVITTLLQPQSSLAVAGATLAVAALFNPLRKRVQHAVDRRFNRSSYEAAHVSEQFAARLDQPHTVEEIAELWKQTVNESLQPQASGLWLNPTHND